MNLFLRIDLNLAAMVLLGAVCLIAYRRLDRRDRLNQMFLGTSFIILLEILLETTFCLINGKAIFQPISLALHLGLFMTAPILTYCWHFFLRSWVAGERPVTRRERIVLLLPVLINTFATLLSPFFGWIFWVDGENVYHRGPYFIISTIIIYYYLAYSLILLIRYRKQMMKEEFAPLFAGCLLPILGGIFQTMFYGLLLMWSSTAFSLIIVYIFLQQRMIHLDSLTGAWTRDSFHCYLSQRIRKEQNPRFGAVYLDLDGLKQINDRFGHLEGDLAIKTTIGLIKGTLRRADIIARLGGDEFIIVINCRSKDALEQIIERIKKRLSEYNQNSGKDYQLACSFGADVFQGKYSSIDQFLHQIDNDMYRDKKGKRPKLRQS